MGECLFVKDYNDDILKSNNDIYLNTFYRWIWALYGHLLFWTTLKCFYVSNNSMWPFEWYQGENIITWDV